jgi:hypothetical protein
MLKMKKLLVLGLALGLLVGCQTVEESEEAYQNAEEQQEHIKVVEIKQSTDVEEYMEYMSEYGLKFQELNNAIHEHFQKAQNDPTLLFTSIWKEELEGYLKTASGIHAVAEQRRYDMRVPKEFEEIHELNEGAYELTKLSLEKNLEALETGDKEVMEISLFYQEMSNEKVRQATELIAEMLNETENKPK